VELRASACGNQFGTRAGVLHTARFARSRGPAPSGALFPWLSPLALTSTLTQHYYPRRSSDLHPQGETVPLAGGPPRRRFVAVTPFARSHAYSFAQPFPRPFQDRPRYRLHRRPERLRKDRPPIRSSNAAKMPSQVSPRCRSGSPQLLVRQPAKGECRVAGGYSLSLGARRSREGELLSVPSRFTSLHPQRPQGLVSSFFSLFSRVPARYRESTLAHEDLLWESPRRRALGTARAAYPVKGTDGGPFQSTGDACLLSYAASRPSTRNPFRPCFCVSRTLSSRAP